MRNLLNQLAREQVEQNTKCLLFLDDDYGMSNSGVGDFSETDRTVVILKMHDRSFDFSNCADLGQFAYVLWANLNSVGSARLRQLRAAQTRDAAERALAAARNPVWSKNPMCMKCKNILQEPSDPVKQHVTLRLHRPDSSS